MEPWFHIAKGTPSALIGYMLIGCIDIDYVGLFQVLYI